MITACEGDPARDAVPRLVLVGRQPRDQTAMASPAQMSAKVGGIVAAAVQRTRAAFVLHHANTLMPHPRVIYSPLSPSSMLGSVSGTADSRSKKYVFTKCYMVF